MKLVEAVAFYMSPCHRRATPERRLVLIQTTSLPSGQGHLCQSQTVLKAGVWVGQSSLLTSRALSGLPSKIFARTLPHFPRDSLFQLNHRQLRSINFHQKTSQIRLSSSPIITMASSLRMSVPKMASMAAQSTTKVARPAQFQKFTRAYSGKLPLRASR